MAESIPNEIANRVSHRVYERLEPRADGTADRVYLLLEELVSELVSEAMHAIGAETVGGDLDPVAQEYFGDTTTMLGQVRQELAEHVFRSTIRFLESRPIVSSPVPSNIVDLFAWLERQPFRDGGAS